MLGFTQLHISVENREIIHGIDLECQSSSTTVILGQNGSGKSSLVLAVAGHPRYVLQGHILLDDEDIVPLSPTERALRGIFLSFQNIPEIPGITLIEYLRTIYNAHYQRAFPDKKPLSYFLFRRMIEKILPEYFLTSDFLDRDLNVGFSGGEKRRIELLQAELLDPRVIILDEVDSGLDIDMIDILRHKIDMWRTKGVHMIVISHNLTLLKQISIDQVIILSEGEITARGTSTLIDTISTQGYRS